MHSNCSEDPNKRCFKQNTASVTDFTGETNLDRGMGSDQCQLQHVSVTGHAPSVYHGINEKESLTNTSIRTAILKLMHQTYNFMSYFLLVIFSAQKKKSDID